MEQEQKLKKTKLCTYFAGAITVLGSLSMFTGFLPDEIGKLVLGIAGPLTAILGVIADYLDDGKVNGSFLPNALKKSANVIVAGSLVLVSFGIAVSQVGCSLTPKQEEAIETVIDGGKKVLQHPIGKFGTKLAIKYALSLLDGTKEIRPYLPQLEVMFVESLSFTPPEAADKINEAIASVPSRYQAKVRDTLLTELQAVANEQPPAGAYNLKPDTYGNELYAELVAQW